MWRYVNDASIYSAKRKPTPINDNHDQQV